MGLLNAEQRVALGVIFMDENHPDWRDKIDVETFRIDSMTQCVFGQVLGHYDYQDNDLSTIYRCGFDAVYWTFDAEDYGIDISEYEGDSSHERLGAQYADLQAEWLKVLTV